MKPDAVETAERPTGERVAVNGPALANGTIVVPEIHVGNVLFFLAVSLFRPVVGVNCDSLCRRLPLSRLSFLDFYDYLTATEAQIALDRACGEWEASLARFPAEGWGVQIAGKIFDMAGRARQETGRQFERLAMIREIASRAGAGATFVSTSTFGWLAELGMAGDVRWLDTRGPLSRINHLCDRLNLALVGLRRSFRTLITVLRGVLRPNPIAGHRPSVIWDAVNANEISLDPGRLSFAWAVDGRTIRAEDVLFLEHAGVPAEAKRRFREQGLMLLSLAESAAIPAPGIAFRCALAAGASALKSLLSVVLPWRRALATSFLTEALRYEPIARSLAPSVYVECNSQIGNEQAQVAVFRQRGVRTILYCYSANSLHWLSSDHAGCRFRRVIFSGIQADTVLGWHEVYAAFLRGHAQTSSRVIVTGPVMAADESPLAAPRNAVLELAGARVGVRKLISVYDVAPIMRGRRIPELYPVFYTADYVEAFFGDIARLFRDRPDLGIIFKPKRNVKHSLFSYTPNFHAMLDEMRASGRAVILDELANPWIPIRLGDVSIGLPFTSPVLAAAHHGRPAFFHDPTGVTVRHYYEPVSARISHGYDSMRSMVDSLLALPSEDVSLWRGFLGSVPGASGAEAARRQIVPVNK